MIEHNIEKSIIDRLTAVLKDAGIQNVQMAGQLQAVEDVKGLEDNESDVIIVVKSSPRSYATPTIPTCQIGVEVKALVRADVDFNGMTYLDVTDRLMGVFQHWQKCYPDTHYDFTVPSRFECSGFQLGAGNFSLDPSGKVWQYSHNII